MFKNLIYCNAFALICTFLVSCSSNSSSEGNNGGNPDSENIDPIELDFGLIDINGNHYKLTQYGEQCWSINSAKVESYTDGTPIPEVSDYVEWENLTTGAWMYRPNTTNRECSYGEEEQFKSDEKLYNWYALIGRHDNDPNTPDKQFAPNGWSIPSLNDWIVLADFLVDNGYSYNGRIFGNSEGLNLKFVAKSLASKCGWSQGSFAGPSDIAYEPGLNNSAGFYAYPVGYFDLSVNGYNIDAGVFWSYDESLPFENSQGGIFFKPASPDLSFNLTNSKFGFSVRFLKYNCN